LPKSPLGEAVRYLTNQWAALQRFVDDGRVAIDNNRANAACRIMPRNTTGAQIATDLETCDRS
jgi:hypothetical protein